MNPEVVLGHVATSPAQRCVPEIVKVTDACPDRGAMSGSGSVHIFVWLCIGRLLLLGELYRTLGATAQDRASIEFLLALGALLVGGLAFVIALIAVATRELREDGGGAGGHTRPANVG